MIEIKDIVINKIAVSDVVANSVGIINALNGKNAMVLFVGLNKILRVDIKNLEVLNVEHTGKGYEKKICNICHILKPTEEFDINQTDAKGQKTTRPSCKECRKDIDGVKLTIAEKKKMDKLKPEKGNVFECPICMKRTIVGVTANLVRDHDHKTGKGREWICDSCNTGLGKFKDNIQFLENVINYLKKYE
ncbi:Recombination endonuclease, class VII [Desulfonema limicola]|uniref:Recombination endonuclease, class VII n=1 Tax=Desulfonema limicola TaxID=45656 RepID=A0A975BAB9_9BACT|nr:Hpy99I family type II restriction endonuclease [Desulfonema limicola]QTA81666.1 Recombination endonuclease, class VII [Desulfonema limicola]